MKSLFSTALLLLLACITTTNALEDLKQSLIDYNFTTLSAAIEAAGLSDLLYGAFGPLTVFAPSNEAFEKLPPGALDFLLLPNNQDLLSQVVQFHVSDEAAYSEDTLIDGKVITSLLPNKGYVVTVEDITSKDEDDANIIKVGKSTVEELDLNFTEGVIHGISAVMVPGVVELPLDLVGTLLVAGNFTYLVSALTKAGLIDELLAPNGPYTVFAPTDDAFASLPNGTLDALSDEDLQSILLYHVVKGRGFSSDLMDGRKLLTLNGENVTVTLDRDGNETTAMINGATILEKDAVALNGVIHYLDTVLIPPSFGVDDADGTQFPEDTKGAEVPSEAPLEAPPVAPPTGQSMDLPPQWLGEQLGNNKLAESSIGTCAIMDIQPDGSVIYGLSVGWCMDIGVNIFPGMGGTEAFGDPELPSEGQAIKYDCMECTDRSVIQNRDGTGTYIENFNDYREDANACGQLYLYSETSGYQCKTFKTSLLVADVRRGLRETSQHERRLQESPLLVNTVTYGTYYTTLEEVICPSDSVFDANQFDETPFAVGTYQLVSQEPGDLLDPSNWYCT